MDLLLNEIEIKNFLSHKDTKFYSIKNFNVLIGKNNSGKSNLFKIFEMLKSSVTSSPLSKSYIFDEDDKLDCEIILKFIISKNIRRDILACLYEKKYLDYAFRNSEGREGNLQSNEWKKKEKAIEWLLSTDLYYYLIVKIAFSPYINNLIIKSISVKHLNTNSSQILFQMRYEGKEYALYHLQLSLFKKGDVTFGDIFSINIMTKARISGSFNLASIINLQSSDVFQNDIPILCIIFKKIYECFFNIIHVIPDKREFDPDSDREKIDHTVLWPNGKNLVKFLHKKAAKQKWDWLLEWNTELKEFIPNILELKQDVRTSDRTILILKENGLDMDIFLKNMGAGILNVAHFLAYIKELRTNKILCIEEPELYLHPGLEKKLRKKFLDISEKIQIFISTHSREFLDENEKKSSIYLIQKKGNQSQVNLISKENFDLIYEELDLDIEKYRQQKLLLNDTNFWNKFVKFVIDNNKIESKLWDFKQTLEFWKSIPPSEKVKFKKKFCEHIVSFANGLGGVLIIGVSDKSPREIFRINDLEYKVRDIQNYIRKLINYKKEFVHILHIDVENHEKIEQNILLVIIAQTKEVLGVKQKGGNFTYKMRIETGSEYVDPDIIMQYKTDVKSDNYDFLEDLKQVISS